MSIENAKKNATARRVPAGLFFGLSILSLPTIVAAADKMPATSAKVALLSMKTSLGEFKLGGPVVVSRQDIESPLARVRSPALNETSDNARPPEPVFKGVYLTPREYTGRPSLPPVPVEESPMVATVEKPTLYSTATYNPEPPPPAAILPSVEGTPLSVEKKTAVLTEPEANDSHSPATKKTTISVPSPRHKSQKAPRPAATAAANAPAVRKITPAEIGAARAFSRM